MTPIQQLFLGQGGKKSTYIDEVFSTHLYTGDDSSYRNINNGIDLAGEGGMVWVRPRNNTIGINVFDTVRGATKRLHTDANYAEATDTSRLDQFNSNGFRVNGNYSTNGPSSYNYASWSFRRASGFFDCVQYTGSGSTQQIAHNLESIPGCYMIKNTSNGGSWMVYHRQVNDGENAAHYRLMLDGTSDAQDDNVFGDTAPTATHFTAGGGHQETNATGHTYICYLFAGGASNAAAANSVSFDSDDSLRTSSSNDFILDGDFTIECWFKADSYATGSSKNGYFAIGNYQQSNGIAIYHQGGGIGIDWSNQTLLYATSNAGCVPSKGQWYHVAVVRSSNVVTLYVNGIAQGSFSETDNWGNSSEREFGIGARWDNDNPNSFWHGRVSNVRVVKGTAVYTSSFNPPTEPLTSITNTKLLCCRNSTSATAAAVGSISAGSNPVGKTDSPFDDPAGFVFGDNEDHVIKCGSYKGSGSAGLEVNVGFELQWLLIKEIDASNRPWVLFDSIRGIFSDGEDMELNPNSTGDESTGNNRIKLTSTGFQFETSHGDYNGSSSNYVYIAIRRPDGYVGKPIKVGTDAFAMDTGDGNPSALPSMDSNFPVDFGTIKLFASSQGWYTGARLTGNKALFIDTNNGEHTNSILEWDSSEGFWKNVQSTYQGWMWKRHAGFDVVTYEGHYDSQPMTIKHSLNKIPEMIWIKRRTDEGYSWVVYHKGLNGGTNPHQYFMMLNSSNAEASSTMLPSAPTSTSISLSGAAAINNANKDYLMMLFASTDVSKVGSYTGSGSTQTISTSFAPRFVIIKNADQSGNGWYVLDTTRGWGSGNDKYLYLNSTDAQGDHNFGAPTSTGFTVDNNFTGYNATGVNYLYYCHA